jgi:hypothetical protein
MSNMTVHCISMYSCFQNLVPSSYRVCCLKWILAVFNAVVPAFVMVHLCCIMLVAGLVQEYGQDSDNDWM